MITFAWCLTAVDDKIDALPRPSRKQAKAALKYLLKIPRDNEYSDYYRRQKKFLRQHEEDPAGRPARRPLHFIEEAGLETALWPQLYWKTSMCESFERLNQRRLEQLQRQEEGRSSYRQLDTQGSDSEPEVEGRRSA